MLHTTNKEELAPQISENERNPNILGDVSSRVVNKDINNLSFIVKLVKSKKPNFIKSNCSKTDFLTFGDKKVFIYL